MLRFIVLGVDSRFRIRIKRLRANGIGCNLYSIGSRRVARIPDLTYFLSIRYLDLDRAASRGGAYYFVIRFLNFHIHSACVQLEREVMYARVSVGMERIDSIIRLEKRAPKKLVQSFGMD
jgi:hypothetical protein